MSTITKHDDTPNYGKMLEERRKLLDGSNPKRLKVIEDWLDYFHYGKC